MKVAFFFHMRGNSLTEEFIKDNHVKVSPARICIPATYSHATGNVTIEMYENVLHNYGWKFPTFVCLPCPILKTITFLTFQLSTFWNRQELIPG